ncbi:hypothetical protein DTO006G1_3913 [Penicillium roqueforti]|uniref:uncharacterized protein n=1 Tax=Penicillium roqueforti TaxID=5082 RepID=UPI00190D8C04|nr:uncharacterized protein LCP9604111_2615 [Penicillium roqueforti]KAF9251214.1 hypothetical protein LCP9604111_2615 [Penicillium roqueforti]KAI1837926.1 hypothetical protein CBS147337_1149 [Penicillium roqueforti]KAI2678616.1 hypothetical protein CBS147355_4501 [Penicillium roqueforti]KAI2692819.1 hypothetical protein LCP963914a_913 [Penicillium roqueforti]KAI2701877.1 hypothetical protein CBS147332_7653 [Penicillium roqueforti]
MPCPIIAPLIFISAFNSTFYSFIFLFQLPTLLELSCLIVSSDVSAAAPPTGFPIFDFKPPQPLGKHHKTAEETISPYSCNQALSPNCT